MLFKMKTPPNSFQRFMNEALNDSDNAYTHLDNILHTNTTDDDHYTPIGNVYKLLHAYGLVINMTKCKFVLN